MTRKLLFALLLLLPLFGFSQKLNPRQILHGMVIADSLAVDNLTIKNNTSRISAVTDTRGMFTIYARAADTLSFSGVGFRTAYIVIKESHFLQDPLVIKLNIDVKVLDEVIIKPTVLTGDLAGDSKKVKTLAVTSGMTGVAEQNKFRTERNKYDKNLNGALPTQAQGSQLVGVNFVRIYESFFKKKNKKKDKGEIYSLDAAGSFPETVKARYTYNFFTQLLQIPKDDIGLFLTYCDTGANSRALLDPKKEFELTDYLVTKSKEYLEQKK